MHHATNGSKRIPLAMDLDAIRAGVESRFARAASELRLSPEGLEHVWLSRGHGPEPQDEMEALTRKMDWLITLAFDLRLVRDWRGIEARERRSARRQLLRRAEAARRAVVSARRFGEELHIRGAD